MSELPPAAASSGEPPPVAGGERRAALAAVGDLPPALAAWRHELEAFDLDVSLSLREPIQRLAAAIAPLSSQETSGDLEPAGFDGLARRGHYDRLLLSEWLLADELPDEFLRRAADGEHAFLSVRRVDPAHSRRCVVLVDVGPSQLGSPRLAQIAALIVLSRRAREARAQFSWGVLRDTGRTLFDHTRPRALDFLRQHRTVMDPIQADVDGWAQHLAPLTDDDDIWLVGGVGTGRLEGPGSRLVIEAPFNAGCPSLTATILRSGGARRVELPLPDADVSIRTLRSPGPRGPARFETSTSAVAFFFSPDGNRLLTVSDNGEVAAIHIPNSARAAASGRGRTRVSELEPGDEVWACGYDKAGLATVVRRDGGLWLLRAEGPRRLTEKVPPRAPSPPSQCFVDILRDGGPSHRTLRMLDGDDQLWLYPLADDAPARMVSGVLASGARGYLARDGAQISYTQTWVRRPAAARLAAEPAEMALVGDEDYAILARGVWVAGTVGSATEELALPPDLRVVGLIGPGGGSQSPRIVAITPEGHIITCGANDGALTVTKVASARGIVRHACACRRNGMIAWQTDDAIEIFSIIRAEHIASIDTRQT